MTRRTLFKSIAAASALRAIQAQTRYPGVAYRDYSRCLPEYLSAIVKESYERRNNELKRLTTPDSIRARQRWVRDTFWKMIGGMPDRTPLNVRVTGSFTRPGYRVEKLTYESQPGLIVPANLYIPAGASGRLPGALFQMGHAPNGKASATYQRACQGLVKLGYVVLGIDPMGQGERIYYPDGTGKQSALGPDDEHSTAAAQMLLKGDTATRMQLWDSVRALDVLASHPLVDPQRLGSTGQSGGATLTMFQAAVDDRLAAAVACSANSENWVCGNFNPPGSTDDGEQNLINSAPLGLDRWDLFYPMAPKPLLITVSDKDFFGTYSPRYIENGWEEFQKLKRVYDVLGGGDRIAWDGTAMPHGLMHDTRLLIYNWFAKHLKGSGEVIREEPPTALEPDEMLWATPEGSVLRSRSQTPHSLNRARKVTASSEPLDRLIGVERPASGVRPTILKRMPYRDVDVESIEVPSASGVWVPAWVYLPKRTRAQSCVVALAASRLANWREDDLYPQLAARGHVVVVPDVRGTGDLTPEFGRGAARHARDHNSEDAWAWASLMAGKPLLGQRVTDLLALFSALRLHTEVQPLPLGIAAHGKMTVPALIATSLDPKVNALHLTGGLISYQSVVDTERYQAAFANFVPNILAATDLPAILSGLKPRRVTLAATVDGSGRPAVVPDLGSHVRTIAGSAWDLNVLGEFASSV